MHGLVKELFRYPVKSLAGERLDRGRVDERGLLGDRVLAFLDTETGKVASAKEPKAWGKLLQLRASYRADDGESDGADLAVTFPDGRTYRADDALARAVSQWTGRDVRLVREPPENARIARVTPEGEEDAGSVVDVPIGKGAPPGSLLDFAPLHLVTTASLRALEAVHPRAGGAEVARYRPNLVLALDEGEGFVESRWRSGQHIRIGSVRLRVLCASPRCSVPTLAQAGGIDADRDVVRTLSGHNRVEVPGLGARACLGVYASVVQGGWIGIEDPIVLE